MAKSNIPDPLERRHLIERELPVARSLALAEAYMEEDRSAEAVVFFGKAGAEERLQELAALAVESGDVFLMTEIATARGEDPDPETWERLAEAARRQGKELYAQAASRQADRSED